MKKFLGLLLVIVTALFGFAACANGNPNDDNDGGNEQTGTDDQTGGSGEIKNPPATASDILVAYFSCTNTTQAIAARIQAETKGTLYEIVPQAPYTPADLNYNTDCRANREQNDLSARPAIKGGVENLEKYDVVFIGYPIWWGQAPKIIYTFLESYDFSGKTLIPFCTSHSSGIGSSDTNLHSLAPNAEWKSGKRFASGASKEIVSEWVDGLNIKISSVSSFDIQSGVNGNAPTVMLNGGYDLYKIRKTALLR